MLLLILLLQEVEFSGDPEETDFGAMMEQSDRKLGKWLSESSPSRHCILTPLLCFPTPCPPRVPRIQLANVHTLPRGLFLTQNSKQNPVNSLSCSSHHKYTRRLLLHQWTKQRSTSHILHPTKKQQEDRDTSVTWNGGRIVEETKHWAAWWQGIPGLF